MSTAINEGFWKMVSERMDQTGFSAQRAAEVVQSELATEVLELRERVKELETENAGLTLTCERWTEARAADVRLIEQLRLDKQFLHERRGDLAIKRDRALEENAALRAEKSKPGAGT